MPSPAYSSRHPFGFHLRTNTLRYETNVKNGVTGVEFDRCVLAATTVAMAKLHKHRATNGSEEVGWIRRRAAGVVVLALGPTRAPTLTGGHRNVMSHLLSTSSQPNLNPTPPHTLAGGTLR